MQRGLTKRTISSRFIREMSGKVLQLEPSVEPWDIPDVDPNVQSSDAITFGSVVRHKRFGIGKVERIIRRPRGSTVTVKFRGGVKHLVLEYAKLELVPPGVSPDF